MSERLFEVAMFAAIEMRAYASTPSEVREAEHVLRRLAREAEARARSAVLEERRAA
jgi:hypothetical protein